MPPVNVLIKPASGNCNMHCDYCFYCDEASKRETPSYGFMTEQTMKNVVRKFLLAAEGSCTFAFQGGEPTLWGLDNFNTFIRYVNQYNKNHIPVFFALQTNGYYITEEWCRFLHNNHFLVGISIDGTPKIHNHWRHGKDKKESYDRVLQTTQLFDRYKVEYNILTVVHKEVAQNIHEIYQHYKSNHWKYLQFIACLDPLGEVRGTQPYSLTPKDYTYFLNELFHLWYADLLDGTQPYIRQFENYIGILAGYRPEACDQRGICGIQNVVEADGSVYPCDFYALDEFCLGNINNNSFKELYDKRHEISFISRSDNHSSECKACKWHHICRGGCYRHRENEPLNYFCEAYKNFFEKNINVMQSISRQLAHLNVHVKL